MQHKISADDWAQWASSSVTQRFLQHLEAERNTLLERILNLDINQSLENYGVKSLALRYAAEGISACTDIETIKLFLVEEQPNERA